MDRTSIIVLVLCMLAFFGWFFLMNRLYPQKPVPPSAQTNAVASAAQGTNQTSAVPTTVSASSPGTVPNVPVPVANTNVAEEFQVVTNDKARYTNAPGKHRPIASPP